MGAAVEREEISQEDLEITPALSQATADLSLQAVQVARQRGVTTGRVQR